MRITIESGPSMIPYGSHMGTCQHFPAWAEARCGQARVYVDAAQYPGMDESTLVEKAVAMLRAILRARLTPPLIKRRTRDAYRAN